MPAFAAGPATPASLTTHTPIDFGLPVGCGGVVVIPKDLADEVARDGFEQEGIEVFMKLQVEKGRSTIGLYPPDDTGRAEYADWLAAGKPC